MEAWNWGHSSFSRPEWQSPQKASTQKRRSGETQPLSTRLTLPRPECQRAQMAFPPEPLVFGGVREHTANHNSSSQAYSFRFLGTDMRQVKINVSITCLTYGQGRTQSREMQIWRGEGCEEQVVVNDLPATRVQGDFRAWIIAKGHIFSEDHAAAEPMWIWVAWAVTWGHGLAVIWLRDRRYIKYYRSQESLTDSYSHWWWQWVPLAGGRSSFSSCYPHPLSSFIAILRIWSFEFFPDARSSNPFFSSQ